MFARYCVGLVSAAEQLQPKSRATMIFILDLLADLSLALHVLLWSHCIYCANPNLSKTK
jgi:hypothetical protein